MGETFAEVARHWMHGARERELFDFYSTSAHGPEGEPDVVDSVSQLTREERELMEAVAMRSVSAVMSIQLRRIVAWYGAIQGPSDQVEHCSCFRSMLSMLIDSWDVSGFRLLLETIRESTVSFPQFDSEMMDLRDAIVRCNNSTGQACDRIGLVLHLIAEFVGSAYFLFLFDQLGTYCSCANCPDMNASIESVWSFIRGHWMTVWSESLLFLQRKAISSSCERLFQLMRELGCYDASRNWVGMGESFSPLHFVRSANICRIVVSEPAGNGSDLMLDLNLPFGEEKKTPLAFDAEWSQGGSVARELLRAGADVNSVLLASRICPQVVSHILAKYDSFSKVLFSTEHIEKLFYPELKEAMILARLLKLFGVKILRTLLCRMAQNGEWYETLCALFLHRLVDSDLLPELPEILSTLSESQREQWLAWCPHTHRHCANQARKRATVAFWALGSFCPMLPVEIQYHIVELL